jgi:4-amino-4-deoxy-L-arabinose transferase-like glycosyltransferase
MIFTLANSIFYHKKFMKDAIAFLIGVILGMVAAQFAPVHVDVQMQTVEKGFLQYFFDNGAGFNEALSKRIELSESPEFFHYTASIPSHGLRGIRVDPIETPGQFEIIGFQINYLFWNRQWHGLSELNYLVPSHEIKLESAGRSVMFGQAVGNDPFLIVKDLEYLRNWQLTATILFAILGGVTAFLLLMAIRSFRELQAVFPSRNVTLIIIVIIAAFLRIEYWNHSGLPSDPSRLSLMWPDEGTYFSFAEYIMTHGMRDYFFSEQSVMAAPVTPVYIAVMYIFLNSVNAIRAINLLISLLSIVFVYKLGKRIYNKPVGLLAAAICAVHGQLITYSVTLLTEPLFLFFFVAGIYYLILALGTTKLERYRYYSYALASVVFIALAIMTRSIALLLPVFLLVTIVTQEAFCSWRLGNPSFILLKRAALPLLLPLFIIGIVATKNYVFFDRFTVSTGSGAALWLGSRADTEGDEPPYRKRTYDAQLITHGASHLSIRGDTLLMEAAKENIRENTFDYFWWNVKKIGRLMVGNNFAWFYPYKNIEDWYGASGKNAVATANMVFQITLASMIAVYGMIGLVMARGQEPLGKIISSSACYLIIFSVPFLAIQRYGLPLVMLLVIPASSVMYGAWRADSGQLRVVMFGVPFVLAIVVQILFWG